MNEIVVKTALVEYYYLTGAVFCVIRAPAPFPYVAEINLRIVKISVALFIEWFNICVVSEAAKFDPAIRKQ